jgi:hypothetical protein
MERQLRKVESMPAERVAQLLPGLNQPLLEDDAEA